MSYQFCLCLSLQPKASISKGLASSQEKGLSVRPLGMVRQARLTAGRSRVQFSLRYLLLYFLQKQGQNPGLHMLGRHSTRADSLAHVRFTFKSKVKRSEYLLSDRLEVLKVHTQKETQEQQGNGLPRSHRHWIQPGPAPPCQETPSSA